MDEKPKVKFAVCGMVRWKGQKLANGIDGVYETDCEKTIMRLRQLGFSEIQANVIVNTKQATSKKKKATKKKGPKK